MVASDAENEGTVRNTSRPVPGSGEPGALEENDNGKQKSQGIA
jgi:hypothetical protein